MTARGQWMFDPNSGGKKIPPAIQTEVERRIRKVAEEHFNGRYTRLEIRFRNQFCYIDAYTEPSVSENWPPSDWPETRDEYFARMRSTPTHLCRLRYFGDDRWGFAFFAYSSEKYELSMFPSGEFLGTPEDAFFVSAQGYLSA
jgi:hypothetical protein